jgi:hypothetical protein
MNSEPTVKYKLPFFLAGFLVRLAAVNGSMFLPE